MSRSISYSLKHIGFKCPNDTSLLTLHTLDISFNSGGGGKFVYCPKRSCVPLITQQTHWSPLFIYAFSVYLNSIDLYHLIIPLTVTVRLNECPFVISLSVWICVKGGVDQRESCFNAILFWARGGSYLPHYIPECVHLMSDTPIALSADCFFTNNKCLL